MPRSAPNSPAGAGSLRDQAGGDERRPSLGNCWRSAASRCSNRTVMDLNGVSPALNRHSGPRVRGGHRDPHLLAYRLARVKADPGQIEQVIMNLVVNARDAMPNGGKLTIETANADSPSGISAGTVAPRPHRDAGRQRYRHGMDDAHQAPAFSSRSSQPRGRAKGTGLGLSTVYRHREAERRQHLGLQRAGQKAPLQSLPSPRRSKEPANTPRLASLKAPASEQPGIRDRALGRGRSSRTALVSGCLDRRDITCWRRRAPTKPCELPASTPDRFICS